MASSEELGFSDGCNGLAAIVLLLLHRRGIALAAAQRQSIASCHDIAQISVWLERALRVDSAEELFRI
ncbi:hypothetical protein FMUBM48_05550 [Nocardia cyriacigeorgica]|nr:hypothetical protein FMUBM48_05550 [Nocardia cyriacigeorgica]